MNLTYQNKLWRVHQFPVFEHNEFNDPEVSNMHLHGVYVSPVAPADDVTIRVDQETEFPYSYDFVDYHASGTHWYHPHHHTSTTLQVGGGAFGALIVEDETSSFPKSPYSNMEEVVMVVSDMNMDHVIIAANYSHDTHFKYFYKGKEAQVGDPSNRFTLVNGQLNPTVTMEQDTYYRWRIIHSGYTSVAKISLDADSLLPVGENVCEFELLAKDGVPLSQYPRKINKIRLCLPLAVVLRWL